MDTITKSSHISYRFKEDVEILENEDTIIATSPCNQLKIAHLSPALRHVLMMLSERACSVQGMNEALITAHEESMLATFYRYLSLLIRCQMVYVYAGREDEQIPLATLIPISPSFQHRWADIQANQSYRMSRFAYVRRDEEGLQYVESPLSHARLRLDCSVAASVLYQLGTAVTPVELAQTLPGEDVDNVISVLTLLVMGNFVFPTTREGRLGEDDDERYMQWDFHDLLFHSRSRMGRHNNMLGGTYRFLHRIPPQPAVKPMSWPVTTPLPRPDMDRLAEVDPGLTAVMEARTSIRDHGERPMTVAQLGEFFYRVARIKEVSHGGNMYDVTKRPYPNGGSCYEIEFYLTIDRCEGLTPGFYWYDPLNHGLSFIQGPNKDTEKLLSDASRGGFDHPQVVITLAARFQRVSWKYESIAYALILKNVGVIYATMYLVATAMDLAPCALGAGDSDLFTKLSGSDYLTETSVGEFLLGSKRVQTP
ncbi:SagB family peptide dehydrogenase [Dictyobacter aurantiacus]|uniref:Dehydrogenase n=1 Tax=Dictyobacter aurantiacus TaxID=1936993 RepID=A0A401ZMK5_9CHLR|nr:SagB family peptide dehydrogenase [Dictyobacter aurantiacus]GCE08111.1 dehydrogenase [Dictyobacter aurantiacus]